MAFERPAVRSRISPPVNSRVCRDVDPFLFCIFYNFSTMVDFITRQRNLAVFFDVFLVVTQVLGVTAYITVCKAKNVGRDRNEKDKLG